MPDSSLCDEANDRPSAPLPVLQSRLDKPPVVHRVEILHVLRDIGFLVVFYAAILVFTFAITDTYWKQISTNTTTIVSVVVSVLLGLVAGIAVVAGWGRQPGRVRFLRFLGSVTVLSVISGVFGYYIGYRNRDTLIMLIFFSVNVVLSTIGFVLSFVFAPYCKESSVVP